MHLWQIRHIPNHPQTLLRLTFVALVGAAISISTFVPIGFVAGQAADAVAEKPDPSAIALKATELFGRVRQELPNHRTIKADLAQKISIGEQQFRIEGSYFSAGKKLRLNYEWIPDQGTVGKMLEVCDEKELWTELTLPKSPPRVTRRNLKQILDAATVHANKSNPAATNLEVDLGMGGLTALLASLERTMAFDAMKEETVDGRTRTIIQGRWKKDFFDKFPKDKDGSLPVVIPDLVRMYVNTETLFPEKLVYLKRQPQKKTYKPIVSLEFRNVEFDNEVEEGAFEFSIPPGADPEDVTKQYLDRLMGPSGDATAK